MYRFRAACAVCLATLVLTPAYFATRQQPSLSKTASPVPAAHATSRTLSVTRAGATGAPLAPTVDEKREFPLCAQSSVGALSAKISAQLVRVEHLSPAEKGVEDDIRCALELLLTDDNVAAIVTGFSPTELNTPFGLTALKRWTHLAPFNAALWLAQQPNATDEQVFVLARDLGSDPDLLSVYGDQLSAGPWRDRFFEAAALQLHATPRDALALLRRLPAGAAQVRGLRSLALDWTTSNSSAAFSWIAAESDASLRESLAVVAAEAQAPIDPAGAIAWANTAIHSDAVFEKALQSVLAVWRETNPEAAAAFLRRISANTLCDSAAPPDPSEDLSIGSASIDAR